MALPVFRAASAKAAGAASATPALPAGSAANDIVVLVAVCNDGETLSISANGSIGTWTEIATVTSGGWQTLKIWWGRYSSGTTGPTVAVTADHVCCATAGWSGCVPSGSPVDVSATGTEAASDTSFSFASGISSTVNDCIALCIASIQRDSNVASVPVMANSSLTSLASRLDHCTNTGTGGGYGLSEGAKATAGTLGTFTNTYATASGKTYLALALRPAAPQTVTPGAGSLTTARFAPTVSAPRLVTPAVAALILALFAPTVSVGGGGVTVTPGTAALTTSRFAPTVLTPRLVVPGTAALATVRFAPTVAAPRLATPSAASLVTSRFAPTVTTSRVVVPATAVLVTARYAPAVTVGGGAAVTPGTALLVALGFAPTVTVAAPPEAPARRGGKPYTEYILRYHGAFRGRHR